MFMGAMVQICNEVNGKMKYSIQRVEAKLQRTFYRMETYNMYYRTNDKHSLYVILV